MAIATRPRRTLRWSSPRLIAVVAIIVVIVGAVGVGFGTGLFRFGNQAGPPVAVSPTPLVDSSPSPTTTPSPSPTDSVARSPSPRPSAGPSAIPTTGPYGVMVSPGAAGDRLVFLIDLSGKIIASAHAGPEPPLKANVAPPTMSVTRTRVYYLDGDTKVRFLKPDGSSGVAAEIPGGGAIRTGFAVSPDDSTIALGVMDYSTNPANYRLVVEKVDGTNPHDIFDTTFPWTYGLGDNEYEWPVGWHGSQLVMQVQTPSFSGYRLVDSSTGARVRNFCPSPLYGVGMTQFGVLCFTASTESQPYSTVVVEDWTGTMFPIPNSSAYCTALSPNGQLLACYNAYNVTWLDRAGHASSSSLGGAPMGWLDDLRLVVATGYLPNQPAKQYILDIATDRAIEMPVVGVLIGQIP